MSVQPSQQPRRGRIVTFYSYKGGTGRSMLLANAALVLASNDRRVAVIDWDLEAPGLHRYFRPFLTDPDLSDTYGLIDLFGAYWDRLIELDGDSPSATPPDGWADRFLDVYRYAQTLALPCKEGGIVLVPAGRQDPEYAERVSAFDWDAFYNNAGGRGFIDALAARLRDEFDYILIDSRTGVADTAGICTMHLPDDLVICFTYNNQSMLGASGVASHACAARQHGGAERARAALRLFPVPTRADTQLPDLLNPRRERGLELFGWTLRGGPVRDPRAYWFDVEQPYLPVHSYFETLAALTDQPGDRSSMLTAVLNFLRHLTDERVQQWAPIFTDETRQALRRQMERPAGGPAPPADAVRAAAEWSAAELDEAWPVLIRLLRPGDGSDTESRAVPAVLLSHLGPIVDRLLQHCLLVAFPGEAGSSRLALSEYARAGLQRLALPRLVAEREANEALRGVETAALAWRQQSRNRSLLMDAADLQQMQTPLQELRTLHALAPIEEMYLLASETLVKEQRVRRRTLAMTALLLLVPVGLAIMHSRELQLVQNQLQTALQASARAGDEAERAQYAAREAALRASETENRLSTANAELDRIKLGLRPSALAGFRVEIFACTMDPRADVVGKQAATVLQKLVLPGGKVWITSIDRAKWENTFDPTDVPYQIRVSLDEPREQLAADALLRDNAFRAGLDWKRVKVQQRSPGYISIVICAPQSTTPTYAGKNAAK